MQNFVKEEIPFLEKEVKQDTINQWEWGVGVSWQLCQCWMVKVVVYNNPQLPCLYLIHIYFFIPDSHNKHDCMFTHLCIVKESNVHVLRLDSLPPTHNSPIHMHLFAQGVYFLHMCKNFTQKFIVSCELICIYVKLFYSCKFTPSAKSSQARCKLTFT